ncbi:NUDIX hydrolase [Paenibacillus sp. IITD108]|uniref:NUDIX hydrolase n=1 Tax=Paenibacillus sp. IITD108 TaxID=3116649 RepID=UPI002F41CA54
MEEEQFTIFDHEMKPIGVAARSEVHKQGYWHETFQCWFVSREEDEHYIYLQIRSADKKDYPSLYDITAAGHLLSDETVEDGVREIKEEIGIDVKFDELKSLGIMKYAIENNKIIDREFAHVFLYQSNRSFEDFTLQTEEVAGMLKAKLSDFSGLWRKNRANIEIEGYELNESGKKQFFRKIVSREHFVPHSEQYYMDVIEAIYRYLD